MHVWLRTSRLMEVFDSGRMENAHRNLLGDQGLTFARSVVRWLMCSCFMVLLLRSTLWWGVPFLPDAQCVLALCPGRATDGQSQDWKRALFGQAKMGC